MFFDERLNDENMLVLTEDQNDNIGIYIWNDDGRMKTSLTAYLLVNSGPPMCERIFPLTLTEAEVEDIAIAADDESNIMCYDGDVGNLCVMTRRSETTLVPSGFDHAIYQYDDNKCHWEFVAGHGENWPSFLEETATEFNTTPLTELYFPEWEK